MINENVWTSLSLKTFVRAKPIYGVESGAVDLILASPKSVCDVALVIINGRRETSTIINRIEIERLRDNLNFILENTTAEK